MLEVRGLAASYGPAQVLFDVGFSVGNGEVVTLLGRNGMGKTTTINTIMGLLPAKAGAIAFDGISLVGAPSYRIAQAGLGLVPEGRQIFPALTVEENLVATAATRGGAGGWTLQRIYAFFPRLAERRRNMGDQLSGGEQQMLAVGRALILNPRIILLDEPLEGLAPIIVEELLRLIQTLIRDEGVTVILVEQSATKILPLTQRALVLERGMIAYEGESRELLADPEMMASLLGVAERKPTRH